MESTRFDDLVRSLAAPRTRRGLLAGLTALLAAGFVGSRAADAACLPGQVRASRGRCVCKSTGRPPVASPSCSSGQVACGGCCVPACTGGKVIDAETCTCVDACPLGDCEPPLCGVSANGPGYRELFVVDGESGLLSTDTTSDNVDLVVPAFSSEPHVFLVFKATKLDQTLPAFVRIGATDRAGNTCVVEQTF